MCYRMIRTKKLLLVLLCGLVTLVVIQWSLDRLFSEDRSSTLDNKGKLEEIKKYVFQQNSYDYPTSGLSELWHAENTKKKKKIGKFVNFLPTNTKISPPNNRTFIKQKTLSESKKNIKQVYNNTKQNKSFYPLTRKKTGFKISPTGMTIKIAESEPVIRHSTSRDVPSNQTLSMVKPVHNQKLKRKESIPKEFTPDTFKSASTLSLPSNKKTTLGLNQTSINNKLSDKKHGKKILIATYFRSGSTFLGDILQQNPKTFYHFEPLHYMTYGERISSDKEHEALEQIKKLFNCDFSKKYLDWVIKQKNQFLFRRNQYLWSSCRVRSTACFFQNFVESVCKRSRIQVMKVTRLSMQQIKHFVQNNPDLQVQVVYLVRDPRGIFNSRNTLNWCQNSSCSNYTQLCREMAQDVQVFEALHQEQPHKFTLIRYEDLALNPEKKTKNIFQNLGLSYLKSTGRFLEYHTHTNKIETDAYSTRRNSSSTAFQWLHRLNSTQIQHIEESCVDVFNHLGYSTMYYPQKLKLLNDSSPLQQLSFH
ncbi:carbohydrate sulfotransferase 1-like [Limulus polyphemus]|uniref:Carbohydrate sulfotransferase 1-like n=1 Tax=Limulus polyphemus TaxID=6850 RepID=A0ABM1SBK0_LIMPO|nr:carbohydrate sulfotransferase 1-like [Limulus polyphemus]XP_022241004.1 carbohydrate sulfotransferase 1-like [Limulus polyphemus]XP_022241005.1 carbohydrate sulfotransferase 1-like [Limulus polyphemus]XP_022241006.1 carbohydrate sulfotransferase 1-like [Limulus polyphemus]